MGMPPGRKLPAHKLLRLFCCGRAGSVAVEIQKKFQISCPVCLGLMLFRVAGLMQTANETKNKPKQLAERNLVMARKNTFAMVSLTTLALIAFACAGSEAFARGGHGGGGHGGGHSGGHSSGHAKSASHGKSQSHAAKSSGKKQSTQKASTSAKKTGSNKTTGKKTSTSKTSTGKKTTTGTKGSKKLTPGKPPGQKTTGSKTTGSSSKKTTGSKTASNKKNGKNGRRHGHNYGWGSGSGWGYDAPVYDGGDVIPVVAVDPAPVYAVDTDNTDDNTVVNDNTVVDDGTVVDACN
jgi:hypothetical protein